ncbi:maleylacetoacetate isomerase [Salinisphaera sp.]|uniref:maleylacetoacetate isomerase n=1 Tax=Salinisphaera sp. TaxID=1914330 RepID=UPI002D77106B|nr:maleylacetoacetate isomerase [Salinisphaera sp.]HET7312963.1 maleylacetoacetate isomerase [Salinisphaera sp.]
MLKLFTHHRSVSAHRVRIALNYKGVAFESIFTGLDGAGEDRRQYREINPQGLIPALWVEDDLVISQSSAIIEYLEERYPDRPLLHGDIALRARIRSFAQIAIADTHPLNNLRVLRYLRDEMDVAYDRRRAWFEHWIHTAFGPMESLLAKQPAGDFSFCFTARPSLADVCLVPQVSMAERYGVNLGRYPILRRVYRACMALGAFQAAAPDTQADSAVPAR